MNHRQLRAHDQRLESSERRVQSKVAGEGQRLSHHEAAALTPIVAISDGRNEIQAVCAAAQKDHDEQWFWAGGVRACAQPNRARRERGRTSQTRPDKVASGYRRGSGVVIGRDDQTSLNVPAYCH